MFGTRVAVLAGDFLFAQSSWFLANLENLEVGVDTIAGKRTQAPWTPLKLSRTFIHAGHQVDIPGYCRLCQWRDLPGKPMLCCCCSTLLCAKYEWDADCGLTFWYPQASSLFDTEVTLEQYLDKSFYKTASLIAASCRSAAVFSDAPVEMKEAMYSYGKHLGLAFQVRSRRIVGVTGVLWRH
jgi:hypothetical protein